jgi:spore coat protein U-like protein
LKNKIVTKSARVIIGAATISLLIGGAAFAQSVTANLGVSGTVVNDCTIAAAPTIAFTGYAPATANLTAALNSTGTIAVTCTAGAVAEIDMSAGANGTHAVGTTRAMSGTGGFLSYELYSDAPRSTVWGVGAGTGGVTETAAPSAAAVDYTIYGQVPGGQTAALAGTDYADTVLVTVNF